MHIKTAVAATALALATGASAMLAAPAQTTQPGPTTQQPGQMTEAHVWIDNHGRGQAVPVELSDEKLDHPLRVQIVNGELQYALTNPLPVRSVRPVWEYQTITFAPGAADMAPRLNPLGAAGWETTGIMLANAQGTTLLLKRPRQ
jgi:hypothetical protein